MQYPTDKKYMQEAAIVAGLYIFAVLIKLLWININYSSPNNIFDGTYLIASNDGYRWLQHAKELYGGLSEPTDGLGRFRPVAVFAVYISKILGIKYEVAAFYMPIYISSLGVVGIYALARLLGMQTAVLSAIFLAVSPGFFSRTMPGCFDDDMVSIITPIFAMLFFILSVEKRHFVYPLLVLVTSSFANWWYPQSIAFYTPIALFATLYIAFYDRNNTYGYLSVAMLLIGFAPINIILKIAASSALLSANSLVKNEKLKITIFWIIVAVGGYIGVKLYFDKLKELVDLYIFKKHISNGMLEYSSNFSIGVAETRAMGIQDFVFFVSNNWVLFTASLIGITIIIKSQKQYIIILSMLFFGFLALDGGNRFAPFAVFPISIGLAFFVAYGSSFLSTVAAKKKAILGQLKIPIIVALSILVAITNIKTIIAFKVPPTANAAEVEALRELCKITKQNDMIFSWWDFGSSIKYYTNTAAHSHSGANQGDTIFIESAGFVSDSANFMRNLFIEVSRYGSGSSIDAVHTNSEIKNLKANEFLKRLEAKEYPLKPSQNDSFVLMRPKDFFYTTNMWYGYAEATKNNEHFLLFVSRTNTETDEKIDLSGQATIDKQTFLAHTPNGQQRKIKRFYMITSVGKSESTYSQIELNPDGDLYLINAAPLQSMILCNERALKSNIVQNYLFGNYDKNTLSPVFFKNGIKVFKLVSPSSN